MSPSLLTFGLNVITATLALGISWGVYKTKIADMVRKHTELSDRHDKLKTWTEEEIDAIDIAKNALDKEINKKIDEYIKESTHKVDSAIRELERGVWTIETKCAAREVYIKAVPQLVDDLNKLKLEVTALPSKLSNEITKTFSEEYQKIIAVIVNKNAEH